MSKKSKKHGSGVVYSTNPDYEFKLDLGDGSDDLSNGDQSLRILLDKKRRAGKAVTLITGYEGSDLALQVIGKSLKSHCGVGGSVKEGEIILQGDQRDKAIAWLKKEGFGDVKKSGG